MRIGTTDEKSEPLRIGRAIITSTNERAVFWKESRYLKHGMTSQTRWGIWADLPKNNVCFTDVFERASRAKIVCFEIS